MTGLGHEDVQHFSVDAKLIIVCNASIWAHLKLANKRYVLFCYLNGYDK
jgi:hypothetical protein